MLVKTKQKKIRNERKNSRIYNHVLEASLAAPCPRLAHFGV